MARTPESAAHFASIGVTPALGDLTDRDSLNRACAGVSAVISTANAAVPRRRGDTFAAVDRQAHRNLIEAAAAARVRRFIYTSAVLSTYTKHRRDF